MSAYSSALLASNSLTDSRGTPDSQSVAPLHLRLPNPPAQLLGRDALVREVRTALRAGPVTLVTGPAGIGKSAVVRTAMSSLLHPVLHLQLSNRLCVEVVLADIVQTLSAGSAAPLTSEARLLAQAIDLADQGDWCIAVDDAEVLPFDLLIRIVRTLSRYLRSARCLLVLEQDALDPESMSALLSTPGLQHVEVGSLSTNQLVDLATTWRPAMDPDQVIDAVRGAHGSPGHLQALLGLKPDAVDPLVHQADELVGLLALCGGTVSREVANAFLGPSAGAVADELVGRGALEVDGSAFRLSDKTRLIMARTSPFDGEQVELLSLGALERLPKRTHARLETVRCLGALGNPEHVVTFLNQCGQKLLDHGHASALLDAMDSCQSTGDGLEQWRLRCRAELGDGAASAAVIAQAALDPNDMDSHIAAARAMLMRGDWSGAAGHAEDALALATSLGDVSAILRAAMEAGKAFLGRGMVAEAGEKLLTLVSDKANGPLGETYRAVLLFESGAIDEALGCVSRVLPAFGELPGASAILPMTAVAAILRARDHIQESWALLKSERYSAHLHQAPLFIRALGLGLRSTMAIDFNARNVLERDLSVLAELAERSPLARELYELCTAAAAQEEGDMELSRSMLYSDGCEHHPDLGRGRTVLRLRHSRLEGIRPPEASGERAEFESEFDYTRRRIALNELMAKVRWEQTDTLPSVDEVLAVGAEGPGNSTVFALRIASLCSARRGDRAGFIEHLESALQRSRDAGLALEELRALEQLCEGTILLDDEELLRHSARKYVTRSMITGWRHAGDAAFYLAVAENTLSEWLSGEEPASPVARRRWQALRGISCNLDVIDTELVQRLSETQRSTTCSDTPLDPGRRVIWTPSGGVDLSGSDVLWSLAETLVSSPEGISKEDLVLAVWGPDEYHPLKHDNKLRLAIRRLRKLVDGPEYSPIDTVEDGYQWRMAAR